MDVRRHGVGLVDVDDSAGRVPVAAEHRQRPAVTVGRYIVRLVQFDIAFPAEHEKGNCVIGRCATLQHVADQREPAGLIRMVAPLARPEVVVDGALARIEDDIVCKYAARAALEQGVALAVVRVQIADDDDAGDVVVHERTLGVVAGLAVRGMRHSSGVAPEKRLPDADRFSSVAQANEQ